jgi:nuclear pore complex protein Nup85
MNESHSQIFLKGSLSNTRGSQFKTREMEHDDENQEGGLLQDVLQDLKVPVTHLGLFRSQGQSHQNRRLGLVWVPGQPDPLVMVQGREPKEQLQSPAGFYPIDNQIFPLDWTGQLDFQDWLPLWKRSCEVFKALESDWSLLDLDQEFTLSRASLLMRQALEEHSQVAGLHEIARVWSLAHLLYFASASEETSTSFAQEFTEWCNHYVPSRGMDALDKLNGHISPQSTQEYWPAIVDLILRGRLADSIALLSRHEAHQSVTPATILHQLVELLKTIPKFSPLRITESEFSDDWMDWKGSVQSLLSSWDDSLAQQQHSGVNLDSGDLEQIHSILKILAGHEEVIWELPDSWQVGLGAIALYTNPLLPTGANQFVSLLPQNGAIPDKVSGKIKDSHDCLDLLELDLIQGHFYAALRHANALNVWLMAHFCDFFDKRGLLEDIEVQQEASKETGIRLREWGLLSYAEFLLSHHSVWSIAFEYLLACPNQGSGWIEHWAPRILPTSESEWTSLTQFLDEHSFSSAVQTVLKCQAQEALSKNELALALSCLAQAGSTARLNTVVFALLDSKNLSLQLLDDCLSLLEPHDIVSFESLAFLSRYREFLRCSQLEEYQEAGDLLVSLFTSGLVPNQFKRKLLLDSAELLESDVLCIGEKGTYELMRILESLSEDECVTDRGTIGAVRMALVRNLARSIALRNF